MGGQTEYFGDPMLRNIYDYNNYEQETRINFLNKIKFSRLSSEIINDGSYRDIINRETRSIADLSDSKIKIMDKSKNMISNANIKIYKISVPLHPHIATLLISITSNQAGEVKFDWMASNPYGSPFNGEDELLLIKVNKEGYAPTAKYFSIFDAQEQKLLSNKSQLEIDIYMQPIS